MNDTPPPSPNTLSWRDLPQRAPRRNLTPQARKRRWSGRARTLVAILSVALLGIGSWLTYDFMRGQTGRVTPFNANTPQGPGSVVFETDGVLRRDWLLGQHEVPIERGVMAVDIHALKRALEAHGQVKSASVSVRLPNTLLVRITEREPVLRVRVPAGAGAEPRTLLIARDGTVYEGQFYPERFLQRLPGAADLKLRPEGSGFARVEGMEGVARLLDRVRDQHPDLYDDWRLVSFARIRGDEPAADTVIKVQGRRVGSLVFAPDDIDGQLQRLTRILGYAQANQIAQIHRVDLSYDEQAVVHFGESPLAATTATPRPGAAAKPAVKPTKP